MPAKASAEVLKDARAADWYVKDLTSVNDAARDLFEVYSGIPPDRVLQHIFDTGACFRDYEHPLLEARASKIYPFFSRMKYLHRAYVNAVQFPYPCLGRFRFLDMHLRQLPGYTEIVERVKNGEKFLDVGCCVGQELRRLAFDGAPSENLYGSDLQKDFIDLGYDLFLDRPKFHGKFLQADILDPNSELKSLRGHIGMISANSFFHLFQWNEQIQVAKQLVALFKPGPGNVIMGRQVGREEAKSFTFDQKIGNFYSHSPESWKRLWAEVGQATGTQWDVEARLRPFEALMKDSNAEDFKWLEYTVRRT